MVVSKPNEEEITAVYCRSRNRRECSLVVRAYVEGDEGKEGEEEGELDHYIEKKRVLKTSRRGS